jgi:uncharacterized cupin superfamily protein
MPERRHPQVVNLAEVEPRTVSKGKRFGHTARGLGRAVDATKLGCTHYTVEPGRTGFPNHFHCVNDEAIYVLAGTGKLRVGKNEVEVRAGDWINLPAGPDHSHQLFATGNAALEYLCVSTLNSAEIVGYPDSKKLGAAAGPTFERAIKGEHWVRLLVRESNNLDYYDGEDTGE